MLGKRTFVALALTASCLVAAQAQQIVYVQPYSPPPLYPYVAQPQAPYAYPAPQYAPPAYHHVRKPRAESRKSARSKTDPALVEELMRKRDAQRHVAKRIEQEPRAEDSDSADASRDETSKDKKYSKTVVVREKPVVRKHYRIVDDPPVVVRREIDEDGTVASVTPLAPLAQVPGSGAGRVIHAEAEVTILGPDRMNIRLYRKRDGLEANAKAVGKTKKN